MRIGRKALLWRRTMRPAAVNVLMALGAVLLFGGAWILFGASTGMDEVQKEGVSEADSEDSGRTFQEWVVTRLSETHVLNYDPSGQASHQGILCGHRLEASLTLGEHTFPFSMECMWRNSLMGASSALANGQRERYRRSAKVSDTPVFAVLGIGGSPAAPAMLFIVPANELPGDKLTMDYLEHYRQPMTSTLFYFEPYGRKLSY